MDKGEQPRSTSTPGYTMDEIRRTINKDRELDKHHSDNITGSRVAGTGTLSVVTGSHSGNTGSHISSGVGGIASGNGNHIGGTGSLSLERATVDYKRDSQSWKNNVHRASTDSKSDDLSGESGDDMDDDGCLDMTMSGHGNSTSGPSSGDMSPGGSANKDVPIYPWMRSQYGEFP